MEHSHDKELDERRRLQKKVEDLEDVVTEAHVRQRRINEMDHDMKVASLLQLYPIRFLEPYLSIEK